VDASLARLQTDYIDVLQIHRYDRNTPIEETMEALHDLIKAGKVRYIGASSMWTYQFATMQFCAEKHGWTKFISMQNKYSLLYREEEREMIKFCNETGVGIIPVSLLRTSMPSFSTSCFVDYFCPFEHSGLHWNEAFSRVHRARRRPLSGQRYSSKTTAFQPRTWRSSSGWRRWPRTKGGR
jgi:hypothetical protein